MKNSAVAAIKIISSMTLSLSTSSVLHFHVFGRGIGHELNIRNIAADGFRTSREWRWSPGFRSYEDLETMCLSAIRYKS